MGLWRCVCDPHSKVPFDTEGVKRILPRSKNSVKALKFEKQDICEKYRGKSPLFLKEDCDSGVDFCHLQMRGPDKELSLQGARFPQEPRKQNSVCILCGCVMLPRGLVKGFAQVVWLKDGASSVTCLVSPEPGVFLRLSSLVTRAREGHSLPLWMTKVKFQV